MSREYDAGYAAGAADVLKLVRERAPEHGWEAAVEAAEQAVSEQQTSLADSWGPVQQALTERVVAARERGETVPELVVTEDTYRRLCHEPGILFRLDRLNGRQMKFMDIPLRVVRS